MADDRDPDPPVPVAPIAALPGEVAPQSEPNDEVVTRADLQHRAVKGSVVTALHVVLSTPTAAVGTAIVARLLQPNAYGLLAYLTIVMTLALAASDFGVTYGLVQWGAVSEARGDKAGTCNLMSGGAGFRLLVQLPILMVAGLFLIHHQPAWVQETFLLSVVVTVGATGASVVLSVQNRAASLAVVAMITNIVVQICVVFVAWKLRAPGPVWVIRLAVGALFAVYPLRLLDLEYRRAAIKPRIPRRMPQGFWRFSLMMWGASLLTLLVFSRSEVFVLSYYHQARNLGIFALGFGLSQQLTIPVDAMLGPLMPASAALLSVHPAHARQGLMRGLRFSSLMCGAIAAILLPAIYFIIPLVYGRAFAESSGIFLVLGLVSTLQSVSHPVNALFAARRRPMSILGINGIVVMIDGVVALLLIPSLGAWGAVAANCAAQVIATSLFARAELRNHDLGLRTAFIAWRPWLLGVGALGAALAVGSLVPRTIPVLNATSAAVAGAATYLVLIRFAGGVLEAEDQAVLVDAMPVRSRRLLSAVTSAVTIRPVPS